MNRYVTEGAVFDAATGGRVGFLLEGNLGRQIFAECAEHALSKFPKDSVTVRRKNGSESIAFDGVGFVRFFRSREHLRSVSLDVVVVERGGPYDGGDPLFHDLNATVGATSERFELIRA